jgi:hypothetical protein
VATVNKWLVLLFMLVWAPVHAQDYVFETNSIRYSVGHDGVSKGLVDKAHGQRWLDTRATPLFSIKKGDRWIPVSSLQGDTGSLQASFGNTGVEAVVKIVSHPDYLTIELVSVKGDVEGIQLAHLKTQPLENTGGILGVQWNDQFAIALLGLSDRVQVTAGGDGTLTASVYPEFGMAGQQVALVAVPTPRFLGTVQKVEQDFHLPSPQLSGHWAKESPDVRTSYLFVDLTEDNVQDVIRYARLGGFRYVLIYSGTWSSSAGSYPINTKNFPHGEQGLKDTIDKLHAAGLKVGMHMLTGSVSKNDPIALRHDARLLKDEQQQLVERYGTFYADLRTSLKEEIADRIAGLINRCGFDMIYFDNNEYPLAPWWYYASALQASVWPRVKRDLLVQGSGFTHWDWHLYARMATSDTVGVATKQFLDYGKIANAWQNYRKNFMPAELGWWGLGLDTPNSPATTPDEVEFHAVRMLALDTPISLETHLKTLQTNGRTEEMLRTLGQFEQLRLSNTIPQGIRDRLKTGEWHLVETGNKLEFYPIRYLTQHVQVQREWQVDNTMGTQPLKFRLWAVPRLANPGDPANIPLLPADHAIDLRPPQANDAMPGALGGRVELVSSPTGKALDLTHHRALAVTLQVEGVPSSAGDSGAVLNIQLEKPIYGYGKAYRDYDVDLNFTGQRTVIIPEPTPERTLSEFRPDPKNYIPMMSVRGFQYSNVAALNLRWMRQARSNPVRCKVIKVEALAETDAALSNPELSIGSAKLLIPTQLNTGDYAEFWGQGGARIYDRNGNLLRTVELPGPVPVLQAGINKLLLMSQGGGTAKVTVITMGEPVISSSKK